MKTLFPFLPTVFLTTGVLAVTFGCSREQESPTEGPRRAVGALSSSGPGPAYLVRDLNPTAVPHLDSNPTTLVRMGTTLYFVADDGISGRELWSSDGTDTGTRLVLDIQPGVLASTPQFLTPVGGTLYFSADDGRTGRELWKSDGTETGTVPVKDIRPGYDNSAMPRNLTVANGVLYFAADDGVSGLELWKSDGTETGTVPVKDIRPGPDGSAPRALAVLNGTLYFIADDGISGSELWKSDGTEAGTVLVRDIFLGRIGGASSTLLMTPLPREGLLLFSASEGTHGVELWRSDGTSAGTRRVADIAPGAQSSNPLHFTRSGSRLFFTADDGTHERELWAVQVSDLTVTPENDAPVALEGSATTAEDTPGP